MIVFEYMKQDDTHRSFAYQALYRAALSSSHSPYLWVKEDKNIYDLYDENKIDKLIYFSDLSKQITKLNIPSWSFADWYKDIPLISDPNMYRALNKDDNIICDLVCISAYSDLDKRNDELYKYMDHGVKYFRYFGVDRFGGHKDCGPLQDTMHSIILSSAQKVLCLSEHFAINAYLCNKNIINYSFDESYVNKTLSTEIIKSII